MDRPLIDDMLAERRDGILASVTAAGDPVQVPIWYDWHDGHVYISITTERVFYQNLLRHPRVSLCVDDDAAPFRTVLVRGSVAIIDGDAQWPHVQRIVDKYMAEERRQPHMDLLHTQPRIVLDITPDWINSWGPEQPEHEIWRTG